MGDILDTQGDQYIDFMRATRALSEEQNEQRERWFGALEVPDKAKVLFELELLLKGVVCFGDPSNHPGPPRRSGAERRRYNRELLAQQHAFERIVELCEQLMSPSETVETELSTPEGVAGPLEGVSRPLLNEPLRQEDPEQALRMLHLAFTDLLEMVSILTEQQRVTYQLFRSVSAAAAREVGRNAFFDPTLSLEFRTEYDHLQNIEILQIVYSGGPEGAQRSATLAFLTLYRLLRYLRMVDSYLDEGVETLVLHPLAVFHNDLEALVRFLRSESRRWLSETFGREVMTLSARQVLTVAPSLESDFELLHDLRAIFRTLGDQLDLETRKVFEHELRAFSEETLPADSAERARSAVRSLREALELSVVEIAKVFRPDLTGEQVFEEFVSETTRAERLRHHLWMFSQVIRGFLAKAAVAPEMANRWTTLSSYRFVKDFISYFRDLGYPLLKASRYEGAPRLLAQVESLDVTPVHDQTAIEGFVEECGRFLEHLEKTFESLGSSPPLAGKPFDKKRAAAVLKLYLESR